MKKKILKRMTGFSTTAVHAGKYEYIMKYGSITTPIVHNTSTFIFKNIDEIKQLAQV
jgi:O-acetylhomoserine/O-acetylserine sulfhydrylase-like pyridoxal-dependent enzyme